MSIDSNFAFLLRNLNPTGEDPCLTSKTWESIASESGKISSSDELFTLSSSTPVYDPSTVHESILVRLVINALQGVKPALEDIEVLSEAFFSNPADRTFHRIPGLWNRSLSTNAFGKILKSIGNSGLAFFLLSKFVDYFIEANLSRGRERRDDVKKRCQEMAPNLAENDPEALNGASNGDNFPHRTETGKGHQCSLVNQAFSVAVGKVLGGYLCALNTLISSVQLRRSLKNSSVPIQVSPGVGSLGSVVHSETSVLEVYLHTKEVRTQIEALQNICFFRNANLALLASSREDFIDQMHKFPRGADLLTYLYVQLRDADPVHHALLRFLFVHSCEPYCGFIKSWIYQANICDPYKEFIVENLDESLPSLHGKVGYPSDMLLPSIKERDGVALPCFMKDVRVPLIRAGQQLQILVKLLDMCNFTPATDDSYGNGSFFSSRLPNLVDILPYWDDSSDPPPCISPLSFSKRNIEAMILKRQTMYKMMREKLESIFPRLTVRCQQITSIGIPYCAVPIFPDSGSGSQNILTAVMSGEGLISCPSAAVKEATTLAAGGEDADASSTSDDFSSETEQSLSFDCPSLNSCEEQSDFQESTEIVDIFASVEPADLSAWGLFSSFVNQSILKRTPGNERPQILQSPSEMNCYSPDPIINLINPQHEEKDFTQCSLVLPLDMAKWHRKSESSDANHPFDTRWPLGGLPTNLFSSDGEYEGKMRLHVTQKVTDENGKVSKFEGSDFAKMLVCGDSAMELDMKNMQVKNRKYEDPSTEYWTPKHNCKLLSMNPMLTKNAWFHITHDSTHAKHMASKKLGLTHFEFSSVEEPYKAFGERLGSSFNPVFQFEPHVCTDSGVSVVGGVNECLGEQCPDGDVTPFDKMDQSMLHFPANLSGNSNEILQEKYLSATASGGAKWENLLSYSSRDVTVGAGGCSHNSVVRFEIPLEVIVDKCLLQEISIQYKYVSDFNIKLLEEGFNLRGHFLALRRYHFMELADWADSFITSLWNHKWHAAETSQKVAEVQGFLDLALQRSSCESDQYKERLFISMKGQGMMYPSTTSSGVHAFDFITLGYRVDWPISIVLTPDALKLYSEIFSFLTQVKLAVFSLTDLWHLLKDLKSKASGPDEQEMKNFNMLIKMRQQVNHFVLTLQQYVQSQLSHVSWCRFSYSLKHQVKDMLDLESVHMRYLADSLHICFLSVEAQPVATIIENILQCALDFRSCFAAGGWKVRAGQEDAKELHAWINFSQVVSIKSTFEKNLQELYLLYLESPKHHEFGLCHFWDYLNYNNYFSNVLGKGMGWGPW